ncbi:MAG TPA: polymer-forming cytoskeletal protein [Chitinophagaceae bacterium]|nr:polymer-forming cytoskeletal protein [Chitinophagaceae bacterium]
MEQNNKTKTVASIIASGTIITGNIVCEGDIRIDGTLKGNINSSNKVVLGPEGKIEGDIEAKQAEIFGTVCGKLIISDLLSLKEKAQVEGDIYTGKLNVEPTISFNGSCYMGVSSVSGKSNFLDLENKQMDQLTKTTEDVLA